MEKPDIQHVTCQHLLDLHQGEVKEHVVLDLRDRIEFEAGHISGSLNIPRKELDTNIEVLLPEKDKKVVVIVGPTLKEDISKIHDELGELGYTTIAFLSGGFDEWCEIAPLEVEPELTVMTPEEEGFVGREQEHEEEDPREDNEPIY